MGTASVVPPKRRRALGRAAPVAAGAGLGRLLVCLAAGLATVSAARPAPESGQASPASLLRAAGAALEQGDTLRGEALLVVLAERHPIVADYADLMRLRLLVASHRYTDAVAMAEHWTGGDSPLRPDLFDALARAHAALGNHAAARAAWETAIAATRDSERRAAFHVRIGASYALSGELAAAANAYLRVWTNYPLSEEAPGAEVQLDALEARLGRSLRTGEHYRHRADSFYRHRRNEQALAGYEAALASEDLSPAERRRAERQRAHTLFRMRRYTEASGAFAALDDGDDETAIWRARALARSGHPKTAAGMLERLGRKTRSRSSSRANFLAALLWEGEGETARARSLFIKVAKQTKNRSYELASLWRLGWAEYRSGHFDTAIKYFERLRQEEPDALGALRARYWSARAAAAAGREPAAAEFAAIAREFPLSYYGWRSRARVGPRAVDAIDSVERVEISPGRSNLSPSDLERPRILLAAGLQTEALEELDRLFVRARGRDDRLGLAQLYADAGDFNRPQRLMVDAYTEALARGPVPHQLELWWHAWPAPFAGAVTEATNAGADPDPALVYAVMREESGYRPDVVSAAGARGLLQLMPETAERVARGAGISAPSADDLLAPDLNIRLGSLYLSELLRRFRGRASAAISSYNAGPQTVGRWLEQVDGEDDEWVEDIAYDQTRSYVKRVLRSMHAYRVLY
jgi:soluble lytic murein transglycosylase